MSHLAADSPIHRLCIPSANWVELGASRSRRQSEEGCVRTATNNKKVGFAHNEALAPELRERPLGHM